LNRRQIILSYQYRYLERKFAGKMRSFRKFLLVGDAMNAIKPFQMNAIKPFQLISRTIAPFARLQD
jgi:hypothetical protein